MKPHIDPFSRVLTDIDLEELRRLWHSLPADHRSRAYLGGMLVRTGTLEAVEQGIAMATPAAEPAKPPTLVAYPHTREHYLKIRHRRWQREDGRFALLTGIESAIVRFRYEDESNLDVTLGTGAFLRAFQPVAEPGKPLEGVPVAIATHMSVPLERVSMPEEPIGPECFGGSDEGSHYMAQTSAAKLRAEAGATVMESLGLTAEEHAQLDAGEPEPEPLPIDLGKLEQVVQNQADRDLLRHLIRYTGWMPVVRVEQPPSTDDEPAPVPIYHVTYRIRPMRQDTPKEGAPPPAEWIERTYIQDSGRRDERLTLALRSVLREARASHRSDL